MSVYLSLCFCKNKILATDVHIMMILNKNSYSMVELSAVLQQEVISHSPVSYESQSRGFKKQNIPLCREVKISHSSLIDESGSGGRQRVRDGWFRVYFAVEKSLGHIFMLVGSFFFFFLTLKWCKYATVAQWKENSTVRRKPLSEPNLWQQK